MGAAELPFLCLRWRDLSAFTPQSLFRASSWINGGSRLITPTGTQVPAVSASYLYPLVKKKKKNLQQSGFGSSKYMSKLHLLAC